MSHDKLRVLVVDDFPDAASITQMLLTIRGFDTRMATTGTEALEIAAEFDPDIALLDIGLPDLSGLEIARVLRSRESGKRIYLAAVTGWGDRETHARVLAAGFDEHIVKPTDGSKLDGLMRTARARFVA